MCIPTGGKSKQIATVISRHAAQYCVRSFITVKFNCIPHTCILKFSSTQAQYHHHQHRDQNLMINIGAIYGTLPYTVPFHIRYLTMYGTLPYTVHCQVRYIAMYGTLPYTVHCHVRYIAKYGTLPYMPLGPSMIHARIAQNICRIRLDQCQVRRGEVR